MNGLVGFATSSSAASTKSRWIRRWHAVPAGRSGLSRVAALYARDTVMHFDIIIGSGLTGMASAFERCHIGVSRWSARGHAGASPHSQGGIAAPQGLGDSVTVHLLDTLDTGFGLCHAAAACAIPERARVIIVWLKAQGVAFSTEDLVLHLTREVSHGQRRIAHAAQLCSLTTRRSRRLWLKGLEHSDRPQPADLSRLAVLLLSECQIQHAGTSGVGALPEETASRWPSGRSTRRKRL